MQIRSDDVVVSRHQLCGVVVFENSTDSLTRLCSEQFGSCIMLW